MKGSAPNCSATGSQVDVTRKCTPNFFMASKDPAQSSQPTKIMSSTTANAMASVSHSNALSPNRDGRDIRARAGEIASACSTVMLDISRPVARPEETPTSPESLQRSRREFGEPSSTFARTFPQPLMDRGKTNADALWAQGKSDIFQLIPHRRPRSRIEKAHRSSKHQKHSWFCFA